MLVSMLAGCAKDADTGSGSNETQAPTQAETQAQTQAPTRPEAAVGDILDTPEVTFDTSIEDLYVNVILYGETEDDMQTMEIAVDQITDDSYVIYATNGTLKLDEIIYEVTDAGIAKYYRDVFGTDFTLETKLSPTELQEEVNSMMDLLSLFMLAGIMAALMLLMLVEPEALFLTLIYEAVFIPMIILWIPEYKDAKILQQAYDKATSTNVSSL